MILTDLDGVLTDGGVFYSEKGDTLRKFNVRDKSGALLLRRADIRLGAITGERTQAVHRWIAELEFDFLYHGIQDKSKVLERVLEEYSIDRSEVAYIGGEMDDLPLIGRVGFFMTVLDGCPLLRKKADYILKVKGGEGVLREAATVLLQSKGCYETTLQKFLSSDNLQEESLPLIQKYLKFDPQADEATVTPE